MVGLIESSSPVMADLMERMSEARRGSDSLFSLLRGDAFYERPIPERHRIIFYVGHLEAFDWNLLGGTATKGLQSPHPDLDRLFAFGIDPVGGGLPADQPSDWPSLDAVRAYVASVRSTLDESLAKIAVDTGPVRDGFPLSTLLNVAIEHRLMHVETLAYMFHQLPFSMKIPQEDPGSPEPQNGVEAAAQDMVLIPGGKVTLGLPRGSEMFGWDNEYEAQTCKVPSFEIDRYKVTNREYLEFVEAGGYDNQSLWTEDGWNWKNSQNVISHPSFWKKENRGWIWRTMFEEVPLPWQWPVYVSQAEASAYARWAGKALPTEGEWQRAAYGTAGGETRTYPWGNGAPDPQLGNFDFQRWNPTPVNAFPEGESFFGVRDLLGNGWEWTSTQFGPLPGFTPFPFYRGYSADFFDGKHFVMKGGSSRTAACMLRPSFRNWFQPHYQYVYAGFRCVKRLSN
jgi:gamma-glutamyl hercynylcysteine S-oxide synthase